MNLPLQSYADKDTADAKHRLRERLQQLFASDLKLSSHDHLVQIIRLEEPVCGYDPLLWLQWQDVSPRIYWSDRQGCFESAGIGLADQIKCHKGVDGGIRFARIKNALGDHAGKAKYYGGMRFNSKTDVVDRHWRDYGSCLFILPQFELFTDTSGTFLACNIVLRRGQRPHHQFKSVLEALDTLKMEGAASSENVKARNIIRRDVPDKAEWLRNVEAVLDILRSGGAEKIVLGRSTLLSFVESLEPLGLMRKLKQIEPVAYHFYIQPGDDSAFMGATPERLYKRQADHIQSEAVAGTCIRGMTAEADRELGQELLNSDKDYREHICVRDNLRSQLRQCCRYLEAGDIELLQQARVQHLYSYIHGHLQQNVSDWDLLELLHPTPAVGGLPRDKALHDIEKLEPFDRGWYAGPVGWIGANMAEFAVGIRSGLINGKSLRLYAGAGVVEGSVPQSEWNEMETKISAFMTALGID